MAGYPTTGLAELERYINRQLLTPETIKTALKETAFFDMLNDEAKKKSGYTFEVSTRRLRTTDTAKSFLPWDTGNDYVGDDPATYPATTYSRKDPTRNMQVKMAFLHDNIRMNQFEIDALDTDAMFVDYFSELGGEMGDNFTQFLADQILRGEGDGYEGSTNGTASDMYGLYEQIIAQNMNTLTAYTESVVGSNTHFGLARHVFPHLVGRVFSANHVDAVAATSRITITNCTCTNGSTRVTFAATDFTGVPVDGWMVKISTAAGVVVASGYEYRVGFLTAAAGQTALNMTQIFRGTTAATYTVEIFPFFRDDQEGDAGGWHINKVYKVLASMVDGGKPNWASVNSAGFYQFLGHLESKQRWTRAEDADLATKGFENFKLGTCTVTIDEHEDSGRISFYNSKYTKLFWHSKYGMPKLKKNSLRQDPTGRGINSLIADLIMVGQVVCMSPKNCGALTDLPSY